MKEKWQNNRNCWKFGESDMLQGTYFEDFVGEGGKGMPTI
jgi:hypothetical protein